MDAPIRNPRLIETQLADGIELAWYPNCVRTRAEASIPMLIAVFSIGLALRIVVDAYHKSERELSGLPEMVVAYENAALGLASVFLMVVPLAPFFIFGRIWVDARRRRSIFVRNGIVWFDTSAKFEGRGLQSAFALTDIARIVVQRVKWRRYPARMVECFAADGTRLLWRNRPVEIIDDLARKLSDLSGVSIEYERAKR